MKGDTISRSAAVKQILEEAAFIIRHDNGEDYKTGIGAGFKKAADMLESAPIVDAAPRWISVKDRLPDSEIDILVYEKNIGPYGMSMSVISYDPKMFDPYWNNVTHWRPLPEPPEMDAEEGAGE